MSADVERDRGGGADFRLHGRVVLVVGGGGGLGSAMAHGVAAAGGAVAVADVDGERAAAVAAAIAGAGAKSRGVRVDVTDRASVAAMVDEVARELGPIDGLVNAAGITRRAPAAEFPTSDWDRILAINLTGTFLCCQAVAPEMLARRRGKIVNIASIAGEIGLPGTIAYTASKGGVIALTRALAVEWARHGVQVNAIAPSWFQTSMGRLVDLEPEYRDRIMRRVPVGRMGEPDELAGAAVFLLSDASRMVTGHVLAVDGGTLAG
jgi:NAD(P)-dependent dehydrogenase (short-subunit alcohol dehydrogenase family)